MEKMNENMVYNMSSLSEYRFDEIDCFICALHDDDRSVEGINNLLKNKETIKNVIIISYTGYSFKQKISEIPEGNFIEIIADEDKKFKSHFKRAITDFIDKNIVIDISCIRIPDFFYIFKLLRLLKHTKNIPCLYSVPYDYEYISGDFEYKASVGDLENYDLSGYGGSYDANDPKSTFIIFLGFEGALALKVLEEAEYKILNFVNGLPPFYQKYKDVSITNNSSAIKGKAYNSILYTPSDNPFEAYNMLERTFSDCKSICISPLGSKPVSLGVCLYALDHEDVRIVYPVSESYSHHLTNNVIKTWVYDIPCTTV